MNNGETTVYCGMHERSRNCYPQQTVV